MGNLDKPNAKKSALAIGSRRAASLLIEAAGDTSPVAGFTHNFYRYPARFSPKLVRAAIEIFTQPGDLILDPFVGGGTTLVEALALGRHAIGTDISSLATFVSEVKTTLYTEQELNTLIKWIRRVREGINIWSPAHVNAKYEAAGYMRHLNSAATWRLGKGIAQVLASAKRLSTPQLEAFARCAVLRTAQWALDGRKKLPSIDGFRDALMSNTVDMIDGARELRKAVSAAAERPPVIRCLNRSTSGLETEKLVTTGRKPRLVITSPPYPGVHVLYHRWQVDGRKETPAPFWIANRLDGDGAAYYTMGDRGGTELNKYFASLRASLQSIAALCTHETMVIQVVAFSEPSWMLSRYLSVADDVGLRERFLPQLSNVGDRRLWRTVPNRKWYADQRGETNGSQEVVLFHRLKS
ncbi:MAG: site-specific DNA-methyltransferase [Gammaproteobacteria bacterium]|nr:site-specific DNA-methyltransferase [Gammaproteobacteria bacterium]